MGELISARADVGRIEDHVRRALRAARARGGDVAEAAEERLAPAVAAIDGALALLTPAREAEAVAWAAVLAEDAKSDTGIKSLRDAMWNALGRPRQSPFMDLVFPGGVTTYTQGSPTQQPTLMKVLHSRLLSVSAPQWTKAQCDGWIAQIEIAARALRNRGGDAPPNRGRRHRRRGRISIGSARRPGAPARVQARSPEPGPDRGASARDHPRRHCRAGGDAAAIPKRRCREWRRAGTNRGTRGRVTPQRCAQSAAPAPSSPQASPHPAAGERTARKWELATGGWAPPVGAAGGYLASG